MEEESLNMWLMFFLIPSGTLMKMTIHFSLSLWALLHVAELFNQILKTNPNAPLISATKPMVEYVIISKVEIALLKSTIELLIGVFCVPLIFINQVALIFPIIYCQYIRIKYVSTFYMRESCRIMNVAILERFIPAAIRNSSAYQGVQNYI